MRFSYSLSPTLLFFPLSLIASRSLSYDSSLARGLEQLTVCLTQCACFVIARRNSKMLVQTRRQERRYGLPCSPLPRPDCCNGCAVILSGDHAYTGENSCLCIEKSLYTASRLSCFACAGWKWFLTAWPMAMIFFYCFAVCCLGFSSVSPVDEHIWSRTHLGETSNTFGALMATCCCFGVLLPWVFWLPLSTRFDHSCTRSKLDVMCPAARSFTGRINRAFSCEHFM